MAARMRWGPRFNSGSCQSAGRPVLRAGEMKPPWWIWSTHKTVGARQKTSLIANKLHKQQGHRHRAEPSLPKLKFMDGG